MTISGISSSISSGMTLPVQSLHGGQRPQTGAVGGQRPPPPGGPGGALPAAVTQALSKLGVLDTQESSNTSTGTDGSTASSTSAQSDSAKVQAIGTFIMDLMGALHAQHEQSGAPQSSNFSQQGNVQLPTDGTSSASADGNVLESSFQSLLSALGAADSQVTLQDFLDALSTTGLGSSGNLVDTRA